MAPVALSKDHKPDNADVKKRILSCGGHLGCRQVLVNQPGRGPVSMPVGPCRVRYQHRGETLGLAMSRSLGDTIVHKSGVSAEPEISERIIDEFDDFFILATDGVWDVVDNNYAVQIIHSFIAKYHQIGAHLKP
jgi:serine/threonine protein phosphatase PrpC